MALTSENLNHQQGRFFVNLGLTTTNNFPGGGLLVTTRGKHVVVKLEEIKRLVESVNEVYKGE